MKNLYYDTLTFDKITYTLLCSDKGLYFLGGENEGIEYLKKYFYYCNIIYDKNKLEKYKKQLENYFIGREYNFNFPLDLNGTKFQKIVWNELLKIPYGQTTTYKNIAIAINKPTSIRAVANAIGKNSISIVIPCHRVLGSDGRLRGYRGGLEMKKRLLNMEQCK